MHAIKKGSNESAMILIDELDNYLFKKEVPNNSAYMMLIRISNHKAFHERKGIYQTLLEESLKNGLFDVFKLLLERGAGANIDKVNHCIFSLGLVIHALQYAIEIDASISISDMIEILIERRSDINAKDEAKHVIFQNAIVVDFSRSSNSTLFALFFTIPPKTITLMLQSC